MGSGQWVGCKLWAVGCGLWAVGSFSALSTALTLNMSSAQQIYWSIDLPIYITAAVQLYSSTALQRYSATALQRYSVTELQSYSVTVLQCYSVTALQHYSTIALQLNSFKGNLSLNSYYVCLQSAATPGLKFSGLHRPAKMKSNILSKHHRRRIRFRRSSSRMTSIWRHDCPDIQHCYELHFGCCTIIVQIAKIRPTRRKSMPSWSN